MPNCAPLLQPLEDLLRDSFLPTLTGRMLSEMEREIFSLPARDGGLGVQNPSETAQQAFQDSLMISDELKNKIKNQNPECPDESIGKTPKSA